MAEDDRINVVVALRPGDTDDLLLRKEDKGCFYHRHFTLDSSARRVFCRDCGKEVDPFTALEYFAQEYERYRNRVTRAVNEAKALEERVEDLKREERNAKARRRRANKNAVSGISQRPLT